MMAEKAQWTGEPIDTRRAEAGFDRMLAERRLWRAQLEAAVPGADEGNWYVISVRRNGERAVADSLAWWQIETWCPREKVVIPAKRNLSKRTVHRPIFRGYLSVRLSGAVSGFVGVLSLDDVAGILGVGERPMPVAGEIINGLKRMVEGGAFRKKPVYALKAGDRIEITDGAFADFEAIVAKGYRGTKHVRTIVNLFGQETPLTLSLDQIKKIA